VLDLDGLLRFAVEQGASDVHLKVGSRPRLRVDGRLREGPFDTVEPTDTERLVAAVIPRPRAETFAAENECDFMYGIAGLGRFRVSAFRQRGYVGMVLRRVLPGIPSFDALGLPATVADLAREQHGLVLVTGLAGSGKTATIAAIVDHVNQHREGHIVTIEDPVEVLHADKRSIVDQREVGTDTPSAVSGLEHALRQDPDVIVIGELRDSETAETALQAAESGHLVLSTMHTVDAAETIGRMVEFFPEGKQQMIRSIMAGVLRGVVSQRLIPRIDGGRAAAVEVMMMNSRIADLVRDNEPESITDAIEEGAFFDMQSFTKALIDQVVSGNVDQEVAANAATNRHDFIVTLERALKQQGADLRGEENKQKRDQGRPEQPEPQRPEEELPALRLAQAGD